MPTRSQIVFRLSVEFALEPKERFCHVPVTTFRTGIRSKNFRFGGISIMKSNLVRIAVSAVFAFAAWTQIRNAMQQHESNLMLAVGGVDAYRQQRANWLRRCLSFAESIHDPVIRSREIDAIQFRLSEIDRESTETLGEELQIERMIGSAPAQQSPVTLSEVDPFADRRASRLSLRKSRRKSHHRGEPKTQGRRLSARSEGIEMWPC